MATSEGRTFRVGRNGFTLDLLKTGPIDFVLNSDDNLFERIDLLDFRYERLVDLDCSFVLAEAAEKRPEDELIVATSYPQSLLRFLAGTGLRAKLGLVAPGKVEGTKGINGVNSVFEVKQTGNTLRANGFSVIGESSSIQLNGVWVEKREGLWLPPVDFAGYMDSLATILGRKIRLDNGDLPQSYTEKLIADQNELVKKVASEMGEFIREICRPDFEPSRFVGEAADIVYATEVACAAVGIPFSDVLNELARRNRNLRYNGGKS